MTNLYLEHDLRDWRRDVACGDTYQGFEEWRAERRATEQADYHQEGML